MSAASKAVLGVSVFLTLSIVAAVHLKQAQDRQRLREGVVRDLERVQRKKENLRLLEEQRNLTKQLETERQFREAGPDGADHSLH
ncbi:protein PET117 homolog, mitochondrial [Genypterus blacodes]|uniref:protein PET117 homolog, mitochondrial n=1 Tax=Genypterus blacodes TaxID=154954 RepID=UPI003F75DEF1